MSRRRRTIAGRDQRASAFSAALMRLCDATASVGAALVDAEGETVDYAGVIDPFDIKVAAAELMIVLSQLRQTNIRGWSDADEVILRGTRKSYFVQALPDGYGIVVVLARWSFALSFRGLHEAIRELCVEAGFALPPSVAGDRERWWRVEVKSQVKDRRRPAALWVSGSWSTVEVLGRWTNPGVTREVGYRVRLPSGAELTLVRERLGRWFADTAISR
jgi:hypothetical protein